MCFHYEDNCGSTKDKVQVVISSFKFKGKHRAIDTRW